MRWAVCGLRPAPCHRTSDASREPAEGGLYVYIQSVQAYLSPPIAAVFLFGILWPRANAAGALASLLTGLALGLGRLTLEASGAAGGLAEAVTGINFLHFAVVLFVVCTAVLVAVSLTTAPPHGKTDGLTFATTLPDGAAAPRRRAGASTSCSRGSWCWPSWPSGSCSPSRSPAGRANRLS